MHAGLCALRQARINTNASHPIMHSAYILKCKELITAMFVLIFKLCFTYTAIFFFRKRSLLSSPLHGKSGRQLRNNGAVSCVVRSRKKMKSFTLTMITRGFPQNNGLFITTRGGSEVIWTRRKSLKHGKVERNMSRCRLLMQSQIIYSQHSF